MPLGRRIRPPSRPSTAGQQNDGGRPANRRRPASQNGYGRPAERLRPAGRTAAAIQRSGCGRSTDRPRPADRSTAITLQNGGGRHSAGWRRQPSYRVAAATPKSWQCCTVQGEALADGRRPGAATGVQGTAVSPPPPLCLTAAVGKAVCGRGHCGHIRHCMLGHYVRHGRLRRPPGPTERPVSAADRDAPCAARQGRVGPAGRPHPPAGGGGDVAVEWLSFFPKTNIDPGQVKRG